MVLSTDTRLLSQSPFVVTKKSCDETLVNHGSEKNLTVASCIRSTGVNKSTDDKALGIALLGSFSEYACMPRVNVETKGLLAARTRKVLACLGWSAPSQALDKSSMFSVCVSLATAQAAAERDTQLSSPSALILGEDCVVVYQRGTTSPGSRSTF